MGAKLNHCGHAQGLYLYDLWNNLHAQMWRNLRVRQEERVASRSDQRLSDTPVFPQDLWTEEAEV